MLERPSVSVICPAVGSARGGELVTVIRGAFQTGTQVRFGSELEARRRDRGRCCRSARPDAFAAQLDNSLQMCYVSLGGNVMQRVSQSIREGGF